MAGRSGSAGDALGAADTVASEGGVEAIGAADTVASDSRPAPASSGMPATIDRYRIARRLGAGAMGVVYAGHDPELARPVAVKVLRAGGSPERMRREAQALARLTHPNVVAVFDAGEHAGDTFVTMALVDGDNLRAWLRGERTTEQILDAIRQAARGVDAAHRAGIVHRDLKPDNIFVARTGEVLVGDFGLARSGADAATSIDPRADSSELTATGSILGTPAYMAPEQLDGTASEASDQFALCVTAWEALYGTRPFTGSTFGELAEAVRRGPPPEPSTRKVPAHVHAAIRRGLAADPALRHPSVAALLAGLAPRRRRWPYAAAALAIVGAAGIALVALPAGDDRAARCTTARAPWTAAQRARAPAAAAEMLDRYASEWSAFARDACLANARRELSDPVLAATERCLGRRAATLATVLDMAALDEAQVIAAVEALEPVETCRGVAPDAAPSAQLAELQGALDRAALLVHAGALRAAGELDELVTRADRLGDPGVAAEASYLAASALFAAGRDSEQLLARAIQYAEHARDDRLRTRAFALRARVAARAGRIADAIAHRDLAVSALARSPDPTTTIAVERANVGIAFARQDTASELAALTRIETVQRERLGDPSLAVAQTRFQLAAVMHRAHDSRAGEQLDRAIATQARFTKLTPLEALENAAFRERAPAARIAIAEQGIAVARRDAPAQLPLLLKTLGYDYELVGDYERALAVALEALPLAGDDAAMRVELTENAANMAFEIADQTDDKAVRSRRFTEALALFDQLPAQIRDGDAAQSLRGRALLQLGRVTEALPLLTAALAAAERAEPQHPYRLAMRSFALAQALWEIGNARDRERARALADHAAAKLPEARAMFEADREAYGATLDRVERHSARLEAWRRTHRRP